MKGETINFLQHYIVAFEQVTITSMNTITVKGKTDKLDITKTEKFCSSKDNFERVMAINRLDMNTTNNQKLIKPFKKYKAIMNRLNNKNEQMNQTGTFKMLSESKLIKRCSIPLLAKHK